ncbi:hypothetical protein LZD49_34545 [Dyadobacter sp. CY261]|uniref:hypothetical protein n=1 Tax=Dyadobacter sp. CY261 TaxID=2907203 RepID=UPI001F3FE345|nr:hypothetical protein [Dyadobacter sp. CY261]MCF0075643.1 hypothetical protein [Dyadobacter sp. CY261]
MKSRTRLPPAELLAVSAGASADKAPILSTYFNKLVAIRLACSLPSSKEIGH